jgi:hypothetical protein
MSRKILLCFLPLLFFCTFSELKAGWSVPVNLCVEGPNTANPEIAIDSSGNAYAVWEDSNGATIRIQVAILVQGGVWSEPLDLSDPNEHAYSPAVAVDTFGNVTVVWEAYDGTGMTVKSSNCPYGKTWSQPVTLSVQGQNASYSEVGIDASGNVTAVWQRIDGANTIIQTSWCPIGGNWSEPIDLSLPGYNAFLPAISVNDHGDVVVVWTRFNGANHVVQVATCPVGGRWSEPVTLSTAAQDAIQPQVDLDANGNAVAIWVRFNGSNFIIQSSSYTAAGGFWSTPIEVSLEGQDAYFPQISIDFFGNAHAVWMRSNGSNYLIQSALMDSKGAWSEPVNISEEGQDAAAPELNVDASGNAIAVWMRSNGINFIVQASTCPSGGSWSVPIDLSAAGQDSTYPEMAIDGNGNPVVVWIVHDTLGYTVQACLGSKLF